MAERPMRISGLCDLEESREPIGLPIGLSSQKRKSGEVAIRTVIAALIIVALGTMVSSSFLLYFPASSQSHGPIESAALIGPMNCGPRKSSVAWGAMRLGQLCSCVGKSNKWPCVGWLHKVFCALTRGRTCRAGRTGRPGRPARPARPARPGRPGAIPTMPTSAKSRGVSSMRQWSLSGRGMWSRCKIPFHGFHGMVTRKSILLRGPCRPFGPRGPCGPCGPRGTEPSNHGTGAIKRATQRRFASRFGVLGVGVSGVSGDP
jgi:hypothetical protein